MKAWTPARSASSLAELLVELRHRVTVAELQGDRICSIRQYWDELAVFGQLGLIDVDAP